MSNIFTDTVAMVLMEVGAVVALIRGFEESLIIVPLAIIGFVIFFSSLLGHCDDVFPPHPNHPPAHKRRQP